MKRYLKQLAKKGLYRQFRALQRLKLNVLPLHFYSSIPDFCDLSHRDDWQKPRSMHGIATCSVALQLERLQRFATATSPVMGTDFYRTAITMNGEDGGYGEIEAYVLAGMIIAEKPRRVLQIGCGVSTALILAAAQLAKHEVEVICVEPFPTPFLTNLAKQNAIKLIDKPAQFIELDTFCSLEAGDLLFVDSTHTVKPGSEVNLIVLEVLPRLRPGIWVHFHDIYFPFEYQRTFLTEDLFFPAETTLLYAFLLGNDRYRVELCMSMLHYSAPEGILKALPIYRPEANRHGLVTGGGPHFPSSIYLLSR